MLLLALFFAGHSLFANYYLKPAGSLGVFLTGLASAMGRDLAQRTWEEDDDDGSLAYAIEGDEDGLWAAVASEDDDEDSDSEEEENDEGLSYLENLPDELILKILSYLDDPSLVSLLDTSTRMHKLAKSVLESESRKIEQLRNNLSPEKCAPIRAIVVVRVATLLTTESNNLGIKHTEALISLLISLTNDSECFVRGATATAIGMLLSSRTLEIKEAKRKNLLNALLGADGEGGLVNDASDHVRIEVAKAIGAIIKVPGRNEAVRNVLLNALLGDNDDSGLRQDGETRVRVEAQRTLDALFFITFLNEAQELRVAKAFAHRSL
mgnify:CR=1 FL=1